MIDPAEIDRLLDEIIATVRTTANTSLQTATGQITLRGALRRLYELGVTDGMEQMLYPGTAQANIEAEQTRLLLNVVADTLEDSHKSVLAAQLRQRFDLGDTHITPLAPGIFVLHGKKS
jgi:hypothetical protein